MLRAMLLTDLDTKERELSKITTITASTEKLRRAWQASLKRECLQAEDELSIALDNILPYYRDLAVADNQLSQCHTDFKSLLELFHTTSLTLVNLSNTLPASSQEKKQKMLELQKSYAKVAQQEKACKTLLENFKKSLEALSGKDTYIMELITAIPNTLTGVAHFKQTMQSDLTQAATQQTTLRAHEKELQNNYQKVTTCLNNIRRVTALLINALTNGNTPTASLSQVDTSYATRTTIQTETVQPTETMREEIRCH